MTISSAGAKLAIASGAPATFDAAGFAGQIWKNVGEIKNIGEFGKTFQINKSQVLSRRGEKKTKGTFDAGQLSPTVELDPADLGQQMMLAARDSDAEYSFRVTLQNGDITYMRGLVAKWNKSVGDPNSNVQWSGSVEINPFYDATSNEVSAIEVPHV